MQVKLVLPYETEAGSLDFVYDAESFDANHPGDVAAIIIHGEGFNESVTISLEELRQIHTFATFVLAGHDAAYEEVEEVDFDIQYDVDYTIVDEDGAIGTDWSQYK